ncbi:MAG: radical SAM protein [Sedimentisphaerales bacterium]|nr:radical SAM protein [Sedimentisphaerales bacterium]
MTISVYLADLTHTGVGVNSSSFPLGIGVVAAYAQQHFGNRWRGELFKFPEDLNNALSQKIPHVLGFSNNCCNLNLSLAFARYAKKQNPQTIIVFGGPNFPTTSEGRADFLRDYPEIDFYIRWDGEIAFVTLLERLAACRFDVARFKKDRIITENCCYLAGNDYIEGPDHRINDFSTIPSAYTTGTLDAFFGRGLNPLVETTRGCPYSCTYCNDGHDYKRYIMKKPAATVAAELEYIAERIDPTAELWLCDNNFGMFSEDLHTSRVISRLIKTHGWPHALQTSNGKSHPERIYETRRIINEHRDGTLRFGASLQSTDPDVLRLIKRKNLPIEELLKLNRLRRADHNHRTAFFTELILALPGDRLQRHYQSLRDAIDTLGVTNIDVHQLNLLHGAPMADGDDRRRYEFDVRYRVFVGCFGLYCIGRDDVPCAEIDRVVVGNDTLSFDDYLQCRVMNLLIKIFIDYDPFQEVLGLLRHLKLSVFDWLRLLKDEFLHRHEPLVRLVESFLRDTQKPLFPDKVTISRFLQNPDHIRQYISGERGGNELLNHKARAFLEHLDSLHDILHDSVLAYLKYHHCLTDDIAEYLDQAVTFSRLTKFNPYHLDQTPQGEFTFDFISARNEGFQINPADIRSERTLYRFVYDADTLDYIRTRMACWGGENIAQLGKLLQKTNLQLINRRPEPLNHSRSLQPA